MTICQALDFFGIAILQYLPLIRGLVLLQDNMSIGTCITFQLLSMLIWLMN